jgi:hypothetical protein
MSGFLILELPTFQATFVMIGSLFRKSQFSIQRSLTGGP